MNASRRMYTVVVGAASLVLAGTMVGAVAYAADRGPTRNDGDSWIQGMNGGMMDGGGTIGGDWDGGWMMDGDWNQGGSPVAAIVTLDEATTIARDWVKANFPGATVGAGTQMPMGYWFVVTEDGRTIAHVMVDDDTGKVLSSDGRNFGGMMGGGWGNGTTGGGMMGQDPWSASPSMSGRNF